MGKSCCAVGCSCGGIGQVIKPDVPPKIAATKFRDLLVAVVLATPYCFLNRMNKFRF